MKNKIILTLLACVLIAAFALGAAGVITFANPGSTPKEYGDTLIGVFITTDYLDLSDVDHTQGKLYASLVDDSFIDSETGETVAHQKYVFNGIKGISYFDARYKDESGLEYWSINDDSAAISDAFIHINYTDAGVNRELKGSIYVSAAQLIMFYFNPVYQTAAGEVYVIPGQAISVGGNQSDPGMSSSFSLKEDYTVTQNGKNEVVSSNVEISVCTMDTPVDTTVLQFAADGTLLAKHDYTAGQLPDEITPNKDTAYLIVETRMKSALGKETVSRELFDPEDVQLFSFACTDGDIFEKQYSSISWEIE